VAAPGHDDRRAMDAGGATGGVTWLGHSTVVVDLDGARIVTDPLLRPRVLHLRRTAPLPVAPPANVTAILVSHAHFDHLDLRSLRLLARDAVAVTARHTADILRRLPFRQVIEIGWDESREVETARGPVTIAAYQLRHWGARLQHDDYRQYNAYVLERGGKRLAYFGDTARTPAQRLGSRGPIDLAIAPIGAYQPWIHAHCNPEEAVAMANEAGAHSVMPVHHQTFKLSWEPMDEPIQRFTKALQKTPERIALKEIGQTFVLP
jgi:L-ascorbate metabolism protein UlaG (beta-lactamase superfamily)